MGHSPQVRFSCSVSLVSLRFRQHNQLVDLLHAMKPQKGGWGCNNEPSKPAGKGSDLIMDGALTTREV